jgi:hypothetical protein
MITLRHDIEFGVLHTYLSSEGVTVDGRTFGGRIVLGMKFTFLSESVAPVMPDGSEAPSRRQIGEVDLRVERIWYLREAAEFLDVGYTGRLELVGVGGERIMPNAVLGARSPDV